MRGKASDFIVKSPETGITPAYAGKSQMLHTKILWTKDHPRLCGEKLFPDFIFLANRGSPPPMRGKD